MKPRGLPSGMFADPVHWLSLGFGAGLVPYAPGTAGTLLGIPCYLLLKGLPVAGYLTVVVVLFAGGIWACRYTSRALGVDDHPAIVFDEVVGYLVAMTAAPAGWAWIVAGFVLFRWFDIVKPWPVRWLERTAPGGLGIMIDDVAAGVYSLLVLQAAAWAFAGIG